MALWIVVLRELHAKGRPCLPRHLDTLGHHVSKETRSATLRRLYDSLLVERDGGLTQDGYYYYVTELGVDFLTNAVELKARPRTKGRNPTGARAEKLRFGRTWLAPLTTGAELQSELCPPSEWPFK